MAFNETFNNPSNDRFTRSLPIGGCSHTPGHGRRVNVWMQAAVIITLFSSGLATAGEKRPNILFLFADDQCFETIRALTDPDPAAEVTGIHDIETPNLDRLVRRGLTFRHAYNMGSWSGAVCVASRTMLNTGRFLWRAHAVYQTSEAERKAGRFWSEHLKQAGYDTYFSGKWHVRANARRAFDYVRHVRGGMPKQTPQGYNRPIDGEVDPWSPFDRQFGGFWAGGKHWSEVLGDDAVDFLRQADQREKPFFMYLAFNAPHDPRQSPKSYVDKYPLERIALPQNFLPEYPFKEQMGCGTGLRDERLAPFPRTPRSVKVNRQEYYAIITHMDAQIGRILNALQRTGEADNTYIFFTADHGLAVGHHGLLGKQNMYDHSVRVPFIVVGPDIPAQAQSDTPIYLQDVMPTTLELAGVDTPEHVEFHSLLPQIHGRKQSNYDVIYGAYLKVQRMIRTTDYKLILYPQARRARLYHVLKDPLEMRDLADSPEHQPMLQKLFTRLLALQQEMGDSLDLKSAFPNLEL